jgi:hypothetical protein
LKKYRDIFFFEGQYVCFILSVRDVHGSAAAPAVAAAAVYFSLPARRGSGSFQKKKILKTREFTQNFDFKERYTVKLDEFHRLEAIALV